MLCLQRMSVQTGHISNRRMWLLLLCWTALEAMGLSHASTQSKGIEKPLEVAYLVMY